MTAFGHAYDHALAQTDLARSVGADRAGVIAACHFYPFGREIEFNLAESVYPVARRGRYRDVPAGDREIAARVDAVILGLYRHRAA